MFRIMKKSQKGVTLIEFILVIVILSIIAIIVMPNILGTLQNLRLQAAAERLMSDIRYVRELALSHHDVYGIEFNQAGNSYQIFSWDGLNKTILTDPHKGTTFLVDYDDLEEYNGVTINSVSSCVGIGCLTDEIRIDAFGTPYDATNSAYTSQATIVLKNGSFTRTVQVTHETSYTELI